MEEETEIKQVLLDEELTTPKKKGSKGSIAKKIKDLTNYSGEVGLFELSKQIKKGSIGTNFVVVARIKPRSGLKNTTAWLANEDGVVTISEPIKEFRSEDIVDALSQLGYKLV